MVSVLAVSLRYIVIMIVNIMLLKHELLEVLFKNVVLQIMENIIRRTPREKKITLGEDHLAKCFEINPPRGILQYVC